MVRLYRIWIPGFSVTAKLLNEALAGLDTEPLDWTLKYQNAFENTKQSLMSAPGLSIPDLNKPFLLFIAKNRE